jgi:molybdopterin converting factor small subunit
MRIRVRLFAVAKQAAGRDAVDVDLPEGATIEDLRRQLGSRIPQLSGLVAQMTFAVNARYADDGTAIPPDAEVACIPPVSGG